jgi:penicillin V acylase-like amidase (Ntn superfamily)
MKFLALLATLLFLNAAHAPACSTFSVMVGSKLIVGKNYDWHQDQGFLIVNKRGVAKSALSLLTGDRPIQWQSRFGSITLNQYGRELPNSGMNESGLVVEVMVLDESEFPNADGTPSINESQWVQYLLDQAETVPEAIALARQVRIAQVQIPLHYLVCDASGRCAAFEYLSGELEIRTDEQLAHAVLTNNNYRQSLDFLGRHRGFGGTRAIPSGSSSLNRFVRLADQKRQIETRPDQATEIVSAGFSALATVADSSTQWRVVYHISEKQIYFFTQAQNSIKRVPLSSFDYSCVEPVMMLNMASGQGGEVSEQFINYRADLNEELVRSSLSWLTPQRIINAAIGLPDSTRCVGE